MKLQKLKILIVSLIVVMILLLIFFLFFKKNNLEVDIDSIDGKFTGVNGDSSNFYDDETKLNIKLYDLFEEKVKDFSFYNLEEGNSVTLDLNYLKDRYNIDLSYFNNDKVTCDYNNSYVLLVNENENIVIYTNLDCIFK